MTLCFMGCAAGGWWSSGSMARMVTSVPMFWVGGTPGSGKSTIAGRLARELDLALHPVDAYTYDHLERLGHLGPPLDDVLASGAVAAADEFERTSALRLPVVMDDVRTAHVAGVPTLVEGPQLHPRAAAMWSPIGAIWLVTTAERTRTARRQRLVDADDVASRRLEALVERDQVIGERLRSAASEAGRAVVEVPTDVDWVIVVAAVRDAINAATKPFPRLRPGRALSSRRRHENDVVYRQIVEHERHIGATLPPFPYACVCGRSGCIDTIPATSPEYRSGSVNL
jgi:dephospho-CoA kinase